MEMIKLRLVRICFIVCIMSAAVAAALIYIASVNDDAGWGSTQTSDDPCYANEDCRRFRRLMEHWPSDKPKAAIVYLVHTPRVNWAVSSIRSVDGFYGRQFDYPIIVFHEATLSVSQRERLRAAATWNKERVFFQQIEFTLPTFLKKPVPLEVCQKPIGYRHMCRFHAKGVYEQPIMRGLDYAWRLDDDSRLRAPINYDVFRFMQDHHLDYGYVWRHVDSGICVTGLWQAARDFLNKTSIRPQFFDEWSEPYMFYNNFEVSRLSLWLSDDYRRYIDFIDRRGGIYYHRWGDAPIKGIAVSMFVPKERTHFFWDIRYQHQGLENGVTNRHHVEMYRKKPDISVII